MISALTLAAALTDTGARNIESTQLWLGFLAAVLVMLFVDLRLSGRHDEEQTFNAAMGWSIFWIILSLGFGGFLWYRFGGEQGLEFFAGYLLEKSLSVDNLFVFVLIFRSMAVPPKYQHRVLFWGVLGALVMRGVLIVAGVALVHRFHWIIMVFGVILVYTALKLAFGRDDEAESPEDSRLVRFVKKSFPMTGTLEGPDFFVRREGKLMATPLFLAVVAAESADLVFAMDSIPAVFAVTDDSFLVFSSNVCAILGLRALYFVLRDALARLKYLKPGLAAILLFVGVKMLLERWYRVPTGTSLAVIGGILAIAIVVSWVKRDRTPLALEEPAAKEGAALDGAAKARTEA